MILFVVAAVIVAADQLSKWYMSDLLGLCTSMNCEQIVVLPVFKFLVLHNEGAAFSFLSDAGGWQKYFLVTISTIVSGVVAVWLYRVRNQEVLLAVALAFILGGAIGNLIDRALQGYVVDFIVLHYDQHFFPAFNIADSAISVGAALLILDMLINQEGKKLAD